MQRVMKEGKCFQMYLGVALTVCYAFQPLDMIRRYSVTFSVCVTTEEVFSMCDVYEGQVQGWGKGGRICTE